MSAFIGVWYISRMAVAFSRPILGRLAMKYICASDSVSYFLNA